MGSKLKKTSSEPAPATTRELRPYIRRGNVQSRRTGFDQPHASGQRWRYRQPSGETMARSFFEFTPNASCSDLCTCVICGLELGDWKGYDGNPMLRHYQQNQFCFVAKLGRVLNAMLKESYDDNKVRVRLISACKQSYPQSALEDQAEALAASGFFYLPQELSNMYTVGCIACTPSCNAAQSPRHHLYCAVGVKLKPKAERSPKDRSPPVRAVAPVKKAAEPKVAEASPLSEGSKALESKLPEAKALEAKLPEAKKQEPKESSPPAVPSNKPEAPAAPETLSSAASPQAASPNAEPVVAPEALREPPEVAPASKATQPPMPASASSSSASSASSTSASSTSASSTSASASHEPASTSPPEPAAEPAAEPTKPDEAKVSAAGPATQPTATPVETATAVEVAKPAAAPAAAPAITPAPSTDNDVVMANVEPVEFAGPVKSLEPVKSAEPEPEAVNDVMDCDPSEPAKEVAEPAKEVAEPAKSDPTTTESPPPTSALAALSTGAHPSMLVTMKLRSGPVPKATSAPSADDSPSRQPASASADPRIRALSKVFMSEHRASLNSRVASGLSLQRTPSRDGDVLAQKRPHSQQSAGSGLPAEEAAHAPKSNAPASEGAAACAGEADKENSVSARGSGSPVRPPLRPSSASPKAAKRMTLAEYHAREPPNVKPAQVASNAPSIANAPSSSAPSIANVLSSSALSSSALSSSAPSSSAPGTSSSSHAIASSAAVLKTLLLALPPDGQPSADEVDHLEAMVESHLRLVFAHHQNVVRECFSACRLEVLDAMRAERITESNKV